jgi:hypothetical protein
MPKYYGHIYFIDQDQVQDWYTVTSNLELALPSNTLGNINTKRYSFDCDARNKGI